MTSSETWRNVYLKKGYVTLSRFWRLEFRSFIIWLEKNDTLGAFFDFTKETSSVATQHKQNEQKMKLIGPRKKINT